MDKNIEETSRSSLSNKSGINNALSDSYNVVEEKASIQSMICRICFDDSKEEPIITPCHCKGSVAYVHKTCLEKWLSESNTTSCELCHHVYETERVPKYTAKQSIWQWIRHHPQNLFHMRGFRSDIITCVILSPLGITVTFLCLFVADNYNQKHFPNAPVGKWTSVSLFVMIAFILFAYYLWVYMIVGYHGRTWYHWWQRNTTIRYIPPTTTSCCAIHNAIQSENVNLINSQETRNDTNESIIINVISEGTFHHQNTTSDSVLEVNSSDTSSTSKIERDLVIIELPELASGNKNAIPRDCSLSIEDVAEQVSETTDYVCNIFNETEIKETCI